MSPASSNIGSEHTRSASFGSPASRRLGYSPSFAGIRMLSNAKSGNRTRHISAASCLAALSSMHDVAARLFSPAAALPWTSLACLVLAGAWAVLSWRRDL